VTTYRIDNHQPQNVYQGDQYIGVMFTAEDAALVVEALNGRAELLAALAALVDPDPCSYDHSGECQAHGQGSDPFCAHARARELLSGQPGPQPLSLKFNSHITPEQLDEFRSVFRGLLASSFSSRDAARSAAERLGFAPADSCTCSFLPGGDDPLCPVHQGRRARGPKPPPLGEGCICDGSGRTCPRHGAVI
jgi:hypothetical protein